MRLATLHDIVDSETRLCIVGDPCQVKALLKTLRCTSSLHASCGISVSVVDWILDVLLAENMAPSEFVSRVDLFNRHRSSQRCPRLASRAVSVLAPLCLPGPESMWASVVDGEKVWADLWPRSSLSPIGSYLDARTWEVVQVSALRKRMLNSDVMRPRKGDKGAIRLAKEDFNRTVATIEGAVGLV